MNVLVILSLFLLVKSSAQRDQCPEHTIEGPRGYKNCYLFERFPAQFIIGKKLSINFTVYYSKQINYDLEVSLFFRIQWLYVTFYMSWIT